MYSFTRDRGTTLESGERGGGKGWKAEVLVMLKTFVAVFLAGGIRNQSEELDETVRVEVYISNSPE